MDYYLVLFILMLAGLKHVEGVSQGAASVECIVEDGCEEVKYGEDRKLENILEEYSKDLLSFGLTSEYMRLSSIRYFMASNKFLTRLMGTSPGLNLQYGGVCFRNRIYLNKKHWDSTVELRRKSIMYHELGHCNLHGGHANVPGRIMSPTAATPNGWDHWRFLVDQMLSDYKGYKYGSN